MIFIIHFARGDYGLTIEGTVTQPGLSTLDSLEGWTATLSLINKATGVPVMADKQVTISDFDKAAGSFKVAYLLADGDLSAVANTYAELTVTAPNNAAKFRLPEDPTEQAIVVIH